MKLTGLPLNLKFDPVRPWSLLDNLKNIFLKPGKPKISASAEVAKNIKMDGDVWIESGVKILSYTVIEGPVFIDKKSIIGPHAYVRPFSIIGAGVKIGHSSEIKASIIGRNSSAAHFAYIGDSIIGSNVNVGAGVKLANFRFDHGEIPLTLPSKKIVISGRKKLGAFIGDDSQIGVHCVTMPGTVIGPKCTIWPGVIVRGRIPMHTVVKPGDKSYVI